MSNRKASPEILLRLAGNLKRLRGECGYTQGELAERSGMTETLISNVEHGRWNVSLATLEALEQGLGCNTWELLRRTP